MKYIGALPVGDKRLQYIKAGLSGGLNATQIQRSMIGTPFGLRRAKVLETVRALKIINRGARRVKFIPKDIRPPEAAVMPKESKQADKYLYTARYKGYNPHTQQEETGWSKRGVDELLSLDYVEEWISKDLSWYPLENIEVEVEKISG